jgi:hypothetical protein
LVSQILVAVEEESIGLLELLQFDIVMVMLLSLYGVDELLHMIQNYVFVKPGGVVDLFISSGRLVMCSVLG